MYVLRHTAALKTLMSCLLLGCIGGIASASEIAAQEIPVPEAVTMQVVAARYEPASAARIIYEAVAAHPTQAAAIAQAASQAVPELTEALTTAAAYAAPHQAMDIFHAVAMATPGQAHDVRTATDLAAALATSPSQSSTIIRSGLVSQPGSAATVVTASVTACNILGRCDGIPVQKIVHTAVTSDYEAAEHIVGAAVRLVPAAAGEIIAAASEVLPSRPPQMQVGAAKPSASDDMQAGTRQSTAPSGFPASPFR